MPATRYPEDDYGRDPRAVRRTTDTRERDTRDPRDTRGDRRIMEVERPVRDVRMVDPMDRTIDMREPRANTTARVEPRTGRNVPTTRDREDDMMYDPRPNPYSRETRRTPYDEDFADLPPSTRPIIDPGQRRDDSGRRPPYNEYFLPGEGIDREVIQSEICRYLGQDATCKPGTHSDGRRGFIIRGYRALTTEMVRSLKEDSGKYAREKERAAQRNVKPFSYEQLRDQTRYGEDTMMVDDDDRMDSRYSIRRAEQDPRMSGGRQPMTTAYLPEAGYPAYAPPASANMPYDPRYVAGIPGNTTPPSASSRTPTSYASAGYAPGTTRAPGQPLPPASGFQDFRSEAMRGSQYTAEPPRRHR